MRWSNYALNTYPAAILSSIATSMHNRTVLPASILRTWLQSEEETLHMRQCPLEVSATFCHHFQTVASGYALR